MDFVVKAWISGIFPRPIHWYSLNMGIGETNLIETAQRPRRSCTLCIRDIFLSFPEINGLIPTTCTTKLPQFWKGLLFANSQYESVAFLCNVSPSSKIHTFMNVWYTRMRWPSATACFTTTSLLSTKVSVVSNAAEDTWWHWMFHLFEI